MLDSHQVAYVIKVVDYVVDGDRFAAFYHEGDARHSHYSAELCQFLDRFIRGRAKCGWIQGAAVAVRQDYGPFGNRARVELGAVARMPQIHSHSDLIHALDYLAAELAHSGITRLESAVGDQERKL